MPERIVVIGVASEDALPKQAQRALETADLVAGGRRHLDALAPARVRSVEIAGDVSAVLDELEREAGVVCVLASGDPGFFGVLRPIVARFGRSTVEVHPAPSSVAIAFARLGLPWDDAAVVSAHGRPLAEAVVRAAAAAKVAVLVSPDNPPEAIGSALLQAGATHDIVAVCSRLGLPGEQVVETDLAGLAAGAWDTLSVVVLARSDAPSVKVLAWGLDEGAFAHRDGMITKAEVRAVALGKLTLPTDGTLWDIGAGSGSVAIECSRLAPDLHVHAVERNADDARRIEENARRHGVALTVHAGEAPGVLEELPDPDRVFVGGGGIDVLDAVVRRLRPDGRVVATYAALDRAAAAAERLGSLVEVSVSRGEPIPGGGIRLAALNPVFLVWGPTP